MEVVVLLVAGQRNASLTSYFIVCEHTGNPCVMSLFTEVDTGFIPTSVTNETIFSPIYF